MTLGWILATESSPLCKATLQVFKLTIRITSIHWVFTMLYFWLSLNFITTQQSRYFKSLCYKQVSKAQKSKATLPISPGSSAAKLRFEPRSVIWKAPEITLPLSNITFYATSESFQSIGWTTATEQLWIIKAWLRSLEDGRLGWRGFALR